MSSGATNLDLVIGQNIMGKLRVKPELARQIERLACCLEAPSCVRVFG